LHEVVGERIVVIENQQHRGVWFMFPDRINP